MLISSGRSKDGCWASLLQGRRLTQSVGPWLEILCRRQFANGWRVRADSFDCELSVAAQRSHPRRRTNLSVASRKTVFYYGTATPAVVGSRIRADPGSGSIADALLDVGRMPSAGTKRAAVLAARSIRDATVIAAVRAYTGTTVLPHSAIHVYRVELAPFHSAPVAVYEEIRRRVALGYSIELLLREYWRPTGLWHLQEALAPELIVLEEVPAASEADCFIAHWTHYSDDCDRAELL
jgi:hypothetical protein